MHIHAVPEPKPLFETDTQGNISAKGAQLPTNLGFTLGKASTGGTINMDGVKFVQEPNVSSPRPAAIRRDVSLQDAVLYALRARWLAPEESGFTEDDMGPAMAVLDEMREKAGEGDLIIWGKSDPGRLHTQIPKDFWVDHQIDLLRLMGETAENVGTESATWRPTCVKYADLMVSKVQVEALWPTGFASGF